MTMLPALVPRKFPRTNSAIEAVIEVEPGERVLALCHWQETPSSHPTLIILHGLESSAEAHYVLGVAE